MLIIIPGDLTGKKEELYRLACHDYLAAPDINDPTFNMEVMQILFILRTLFY